MNQRVFLCTICHCCCSVTKSCPTLCDCMECSTPGFPVLHHLLDFAQTHLHGVVMSSHPSSLLCPSPYALSLSNELAFHIRWPKFWSLSFSISPFNEYSGLISFKIDKFDLLAVQGTLKSLLQHHNSKTSILQCSVFFMVQFSHPYMTAGKIIALTIWTFVGKVMSFLFNTLSRFVIAFLPGANIFSFCGCSHHLQWFSSPRK